MDVYTNALPEMEMQAATACMPRVKVRVRFVSANDKRLSVRRSVRCYCLRYKEEKWYARQDSNLWPLGPQPNALSTELRARVPSQSMAQAVRAVNSLVWAGG